MNRFFPEIKKNFGFGMMRLPMKRDEQDKEIIDQERVNELVDYALAHGVNYFDTAPVYCKGASEKATGIAPEGKLAKLL